MKPSIDKTIIDKSNAWPFVEAKKILRERKQYIEKKNKKLEAEYEKKLLENAEELTKQQIELDAVAAEKQKLIEEMNALKGVKKEKNNSPK